MDVSIVAFHQVRLPTYLVYEKINKHVCYPTQVCDNEWHHYAVNVRFPNVELVVDGEPLSAGDGRAPEVIDDWPLHPAHGINTTMAVGACWQGTCAWDTCGILLPLS